VLLGRGEELHWNRDRAEADVAGAERAHRQRATRGGTPPGTLLRACDRLGRGRASCKLYAWPPELHILSDDNGLPLLAGISAGNPHDSEGLKPTIEGHQTRHAPQRLHADKAYDRADPRRWLRWKRTGVPIAREASNPAND
jgi:hypothetical protein